MTKVRTNRSLWVVSLLLVALLAVTGNAYAIAPSSPADVTASCVDNPAAKTITCTATIPSTVTSWTQNVIVPKFKSAQAPCPNCTLGSASISANGSLLANPFIVNNLGLSTINASVGLQGELILGTLATVGLITNSGTQAIPPGGSFDFAAPNGIGATVIANQGIPAANLGDVTAIVPGANETFNFPVTCNAITTTRGGGTQTTDVTTRCTATVTVVYNYNSPTAVTLASFTASPASRPGISVNWETASEVNTLGFNLWRSEKASSESVKINSNLIPAQGIGGGNYQYVDETARLGVAYSYRLQTVDSDGTTSMAAPVSAILPTCTSRGAERISWLHCAWSPLSVR